MSLQRLVRSPRRSPGFRLPTVGRELTLRLTPRGLVWEAHDENGLQWLRASGLDGRCFASRRRARLALSACAQELPLPICGDRDVPAQAPTEDTDVAAETEVVWDLSQELDLGEEEDSLGAKRHWA